MRDDAYCHSLSNMVRPEENVYSFTVTECTGQFASQWVYYISSSSSPFSNFRIAKRSKDILSVVISCFYRQVVSSYIKQTSDERTGNVYSLLIANFMTQNHLLFSKLTL